MVQSSPVTRRRCQSSAVRRTAVRDGVDRSDVKIVQGHRVIADNRRLNDRWFKGRRLILHFLCRAEVAGRRPKAGGLFGADLMSGRNPGRGIEGGNRHWGPGSRGIIIMRW